MVPMFGPVGPPGTSCARRREAPDRPHAGGLLLSFVTMAFAYVSLDFILGLVPHDERRVLSRGDREGTVAIDCYPTNPRGYFDAHLADPDTRTTYEQAGIRRVQDCASHAPYAVEYRYNSLHYRDREPRARRPGVFRVAVLGDSFTEGQGVKEADTYPRVLEAILNGAGRRRWEVLNFGRRGADFPALEENFEQLLAASPDLVVYGLVLNDGEQSDAFRASDPLLSDWATGRGRHLVSAKSQPFGRRTASFVQGRIEKLRVDHGMEVWYHDLYGERNWPGWASTQARIETMHARMRERGGRFVVVIWPLLVDLDGRYPYRSAHDAILGFCPRSGIPCFDLPRTFSGSNPAGLWVHPLDPHPNEVAHRLAARELAPLVRSLLNPAPGSS